MDHLSFLSHGNVLMAALRLYGLRGLNDGEHDVFIPPEWKRCPPMKLDDTTCGMEALRVRSEAQ